MVHFIIKTEKKIYFVDYVSSNYYFVYTFGAEAYKNKNYLIQVINSQEHNYRYESLDKIFLQLNYENVRIFIEYAN
jgi:hypothetical protein